MSICNGEPSDEKLFTFLATAAERQLREVKVQNVANAAWAVATANHLDEKPLASMAKAAVRRPSEFNGQMLLTRLEDL